MGSTHPSVFWPGRGWWAAIHRRDCQGNQCRRGQPTKQAGQGHAGGKMSLERAGPGSCRLLGEACLCAGEGSTTLKNNPLLFLRAFKPLRATLLRRPHPVSSRPPLSVLLEPFQLVLCTCGLQRHVHRRRGVSDHPFRRRPLASQALSLLWPCSTCYPLQTLTDPCA